MKTIINCFNLIGEYRRKVTSSYMCYKEGDNIQLDSSIYEVRSVLHDENTGIKTVNAYSVLY